MHRNLLKFDKLWHGCSGGDISEEIEGCPRISDWRCDSNGISTGRLRHAQMRNWYLGVDGRHEQSHE